MRIYVHSLNEEEHKMMHLAALNIRNKIKGVKIRAYHTDYMWYTIIETENEETTLRVGIELGKLEIF